MQCPNNNIVVPVCRCTPERFPGVHLTQAYARESFGVHGLQTASYPDDRIEDPVSVESHPGSRLSGGTLTLFSLQSYLCTLVGFSYDLTK